MVPVFKNPAWQAQFESEGFVKLKLFTPEQIAALRNYYNTIKPEHEAHINTRNLHASVETGNLQLMKEVDAFVKQTIMQQVEDTFKNYQLLVSNYLVKESGDDTELMPHQDLHFVNEPEHCSFNLWIPLQPTNHNSGQLRVLKGSHKIKTTLRVAPKSPRPFVAFQETIRQLFTNIETEIGECVVLNHAVIHGSTTNTTGQPRVAVILTLCSAPAPLHYHYMANDNPATIERYRMTAEDYYCFKEDGRPLHAPLTETISHRFTPCTEQEFKQWVKNSPHFNMLTKLKLLYFTQLSNNNVL